jgi:molybdate transport system substrate-binding protein
MIRGWLFLFAMALLPGCEQEATRGQRVTVFAAASLRSAFEEIANRFEDAHPDTKVDLHLAGTSRLAFQIEEGAPADVFASADDVQMDRLVGRGFVAGEPRVFARNELAIVTAPGNPRRIAGLADFSRTDLRLALCGPEVPGGRYAREALARSGVAHPPSSDEPHVKAVVAKVELGEVDAGIVYRTDVLAAAERVQVVQIPPEQQVVVAYPIATLAGSRSPSAAQAFVSFVLGDTGRAVLVSEGFALP